MDPSHVEPDQLQSLIFRACTAWEAKTGRKLGDEASVLEFLRALKNEDLLLNADQATAGAVREALIGLNLESSTSLSNILLALGITGESQELFLTTLKNSSQREAMIKNAFAADTPAETAQALETIAAREDPQSLFGCFLTPRPTETGKISVGAVVTFSVLSVIVVILVFVALGPQIKNMFAPAYKGVTPDPGGDYA